MSSERTLAVFNQVSAVSLKALVERGLAEPGGDAFLQLSNLVLEADLTQQAQVLAEDGTVATAGARVRRLATLSGVVLVEDGAILTSAPALNVAVTNALFEGRYGLRLPELGGAFVGVDLRQALDSFLLNNLAGQVAADSYRRRARPYYLGQCGLIATLRAPGPVSPLERAMKTSDFDYALPPALIAQHPPTVRGQSRLLHLRGGAAPLEHRQVAALPGLLRTGDLLVFNDTRVIPARVFGRKATGEQIEVLLERAVSSHRALVQVRASKAPKAGSELFLGPEALPVSVLGRREALFELAFPAKQEVLPFFETVGEMPLPPTLNDRRTLKTMRAIKRCMRGTRGPSRRPRRGSTSPKPSWGNGSGGRWSRPPLPCTWGRAPFPRARGRANGPSHA